MALELLIALAILLLLLFLGWFVFLRGRGPLAGTLPAGTVPTQPVDRWLTAPAQITVGTPATFVFESMNMNPVAISTNPLTAINGRTIGFTTTPAAVRIVSINGTAVNASIGSGVTVAPNGQVTVVIVADSLPAPAAGEEAARGALVGIPAATTTTQAAAEFTIVQ